jgi:hypothetical protein
VPLLYYVSSMFCFRICFILLLYGPVFLTTGIRVKGNLQEKRVPSSSGSNVRRWKVRVDKFNGQKYQLWNMQMEDYLCQKDLFLPLGRIAKKSAATKDEEWEILDRKTLGTIRLSLVASMAFNYSKEKTTKGLMDTLANCMKNPRHPIRYF